MNMYRNGSYTPLTSAEAVEITKEMYKILTGAGINVIRVGLKSSDLIREDGEIQGNTFHPAFRQLVEGEIAREKMETLLAENLPEPADPCWEPFTLKELTFYSNDKWFSNMIGHKGCNKKHFEAALPDWKINYKTMGMDDNLIGLAVAGSAEIMVK